MYRPRLTPDVVTAIDLELLHGLGREGVEFLLLQLRDELLAAWNRQDQNSTNSSRPPSSDNPYSRQADREKAKAEREKGDDKADAGDGATDGAAGEKPPAKPSGKRPGMPGFWRQQPIIADHEVNHVPEQCDACRAAFTCVNRGRMDSAHYTYDLDRNPLCLRASCVKHRYFAVTCECGHETVARPGIGASSVVEGRQRNLRLTERCLVGPMLAGFIASLAIRYRLSRAKVREFLLDWLGLELGVASINRCIHEFGFACEPVVEALLEDVRAADIVNLDETPWYQDGDMLWLWVASTKETVVFHIGSRRKEELAELIGEGFLGWLVTDGYFAYRDHPRRQRCVAHLIRKAVALATGHYQSGSAFGRDLARDLRDLIRAVAEGETDSRVKRLMKRIKWGCQRNQYEDEDKVRALAREILNDWDAVIAFVNDPNLPPTNNDAERALRHAVIARRISFGTRTNEGSRFYAAALSVIETCRRRAVDAWAFARDLIAAARRGASCPSIPQPAVPP